MLHQKRDGDGRRTWRRMGAAMVALVLFAAAAPARADSPGEADGPGPARHAAPVSGGVSLEVSQGKLVVLSAPATTVFIADPVIADVQVANADHVFVFGKKAGHTNLYALGVDGVLLKSLAVDVVNQTGRAQQLTNSVPGTGDVRVGNTNAGLVLGGRADTPAAAAQANRAAVESAPEKSVIDDRVKIRSSAQVSLHVRIAEVSRTVTKQLGINWNGILNQGAFAYGLFTGRTLFTAATGGATAQFIPAAPLQGAGQPGSLIGGYTLNGNTINAVIDALAEEQLLKVLAEPNLTAMSGESASFLAGGEFPIPVSQALGVVTIEFKAFGVGLNFVPTVMAPNHISLKVRPEVSQISSQGAIALNGITIPALSVRRAETTIELGSGQSFVIAGLLQDNSSNDIQRFPGLGDLPVLGALFRSTSFQRNESELLIIVTPYIVTPIDDPKAIRLPTDSWQTATDVERIFYGLNVSPYPHGIAPPGPGGAANAPPHLVGAAGFEIE